MTSVAYGLQQGENSLVGPSGLAVHSLGDVGPDGSIQRAMQNAMQNSMHGGLPPGLQQSSQSSEGIQGMDNAHLSDGVHQGYETALSLQGVAEEAEVHGHSHAMEHHHPSDARVEPYSPLNIHDIMPIEAARVRFLHLIIDHFVAYHIIPITEESQAAASQSPVDRRKRKAKEMDDDPQGSLEQSSVKPSYEGDPRHVLPLIFVANAYETLVNEVNDRMAEIEGLRGKTMGLALEAAGGLYRRIVEKFPKSGALTIFRRREMASALEARARFPQLVTGRDEKRVRFIVVHGLELVERPQTLSPEDAEWFRRITGRHEVALYARDYKYFTPRTKTRRVSSQQQQMQADMATGAHGHLQLTDAVTDHNGRRGQHDYVLQVQGLTGPLGDGQQQHQQQQHPGQGQQPPNQQQQQMVHVHSHNHALPHHHQQHHPHHQHHAQLHQGQPPPHMGGPGQHGGHHQGPPPGQQQQVPGGPQGQQAQAPGGHPQQMHLGQGHIGRSLVGNPHHMGVVIAPPGLAKFCDECGAAYVRDSSKFCSECGTKRPGL